MNCNTTRWLKVSAFPALGVAVTIALLSAAAAAPPSPNTTPPAATHGTIAYVMTDKYWSVYETPNKAECPQGFNDGPREQFKKLFSDGKQRSIVEAQLKREGEQWHPTTAPEPFVFHEAQSKISYGMDLDGKIGPNDFDGPNGEKGIDNQLYRAIGCIGHYRTGGTINHFENLFMRSYDDARIVIELTGVDSLVNDDDVTVTTYRGDDGLLQDATGEGFIPGGTQRIDMRWGKQYIARLKGRIVNGVLTTEPIDRIELPWGVTFGTSGYHVLRGMRLQLKLTEDRAEGLIAGYVDVDAFIHHLNTSWSTHHHSYGQLSSPSLYRALRRLADGYPDPKTGLKTAISAAVTTKFVQVYVIHPAKSQLVVSAGK